MWALGVGSFAIGTGEFVIMGLLPEVARDLGVTIPQAGHVITAYALGVVVGAPVLAVLAAELAAARAADRADGAVRRRQLRQRAARRATSR